MAYRNYAVANGFIVAKDGNGDFSSIASALSAAVSGDTIFIRPGTYTENPTLVAGVNLCASGSDNSLNATGNVIISGKCTLTAAGSVTISGIQLQTNSDFLLAVTGSAASVVNLNNCYLNISNHTGITFTSSSPSCAINLNNCQGNLGTTGIGIHSSSAAGPITYNSCYFTNSGASTTSSTSSASAIEIFSSTFNSPFSCSSSAFISVFHSNFLCASQNTTSITTSGTGTTSIIKCHLSSGSASALSVGSGTSVIITLTNCSSSNANTITGTGTLSFYAGLTNSLGSLVVNASTMTGGAIQGGVIQAPSAGNIGEQIRSFVATGSAVSMSTGSTTNITSISLTAGIWDISFLIDFTGTAAAMTNLVAAISTSNSGLGTNGDSVGRVNTANLTVGGASIIVPAYRVTLTSTTTYYVNANCSFAAGTCSGFGRLSATRVG